MNSLLSLRELQRGFARALTGGDSEPFGQLLVSDRFSGARRLQVYRNNTYTSLTAALRDIYPVVNRLVGDGFFSYAGHEYIGEHPSRSGNLHDFGDRFAEFLETFQPAAGHGYLPDVARLEWAWHRAFHAAEHDRLDVSRLAAVPPEHHGALRFRAHPSVNLISSPFPVLRIWEANQDGFRGDPQVDLDQGPQRVLVWRPDGEVFIEALQAGDYALLASLANAASFADACEAAGDAEAGLDVGACLRRYVVNSVVVDFEVPAPGTTPSTDPGRT